MSMAADDSETTELIRRADLGDVSARQRLLSRFRPRLRTMIALRFDPRLATRFDPSDVVQEALAEAGEKLDGYLRARPLPFYPWLRRLAGERLLRLQRQHLWCQKRGVGREEVQGFPLPDESARMLADRLVASGTTPSRHLIREESRTQVREALRRLAPNDREVLVMRYLEQLAFAEIAAALGVTEGAVKVRHFRALDRVRRILGDGSEGGGR
jgi:RNA polymerase sigma-70 factor (ECF subfamily)